MFSEPYQFAMQLFVKSVFVIHLSVRPKYVVWMYSLNYDTMHILVSEGFYKTHNHTERVLLYTISVKSVVYVIE